MLNPLESRSFFLFGARGTGKTSWLQNKFTDKNAHWFNLLNPQLEERYSLRPQSFYEEIQGADAEAKKWIIIDEIQKVPKLLDLVHLALSENLPFRFILICSNARKLKRGAANLLAGRASVYHLFGLTHLEWDKNFNLHDSLEWGDLPDLSHMTSNEEKKEYLLAYALTYLKEEIQVEQLVRNLPPFRRFLEVAAQMNGTILNYSKIASDVGVDYKTVQNYYQILEETLVGFFLPSFSKSLRKQQRKAPKFYFFDLGVTRALNRVLDIPLGKKSSDYGHSFEHYIIKEILSISSYKRLSYQFYYSMTKEGREVDLIVDRPGQADLFIEINSSENVSETHLSYLRKLRQEYPLNEYLCFAQEKRPRTVDGVRILPWKLGIAEYF